MAARNGPAWAALILGRPAQQPLRGRSMRSVLLYFIGIPIPIILLLALCTHHF